MIKSGEWVYQHLVGEFNHWNVCLSGLVEENGTKYFCQLSSDPDALDEDLEYTIYPINWTDECEAYLTDYREAYHHWFYNKAGERLAYDGRPLGWFRDKWKGQNPLHEARVLD